MAAPVKPLLAWAAARLFHPSDHKNVLRQEGFVTFKPQGFVRAKDPSSLLCRHYYEVQRLRRSLSRVGELGVARSRSLEIGCGYGRLSAHIAEHFDLHDAVDVSESALVRGRQCYPFVHFTRASAADLPFANQTFDAIVTWTVLQHVPNDLIGRALSEIARVAKAKSLIVLCEATRYADKPQADSAHTHDRSPAFYASAFAPRPLVTSEHITELDAIPGMDSPGQLMVFGPVD